MNKGSHEKIDMKKKIFKYENLCLSENGALYLEHDQWRAKRLVLVTTRTKEF